MPRKAKAMQYGMKKAPDIKGKQMRKPRNTNLFTRPISTLICQNSESCALLITQCILLLHQCSLTHRHLLHHNFVLFLKYCRFCLHLHETFINVYFYFVLFFYWLCFFSSSFLSLDYNIQLKLCSFKSYISTRALAYPRHFCNTGTGTSRRSLDPRHTPGRTAGSPAQTTSFLSPDSRRQTRNQSRLASEQTHKEGVNV